MHLAKAAPLGDRDVRLEARPFNLLRSMALLTSTLRLRAKQVSRIYSDGP